MSYLDKLRNAEISRKPPSPDPTKPTEAPSVGSVGTPLPRFSNIRGEEYTAADLHEMDRLLRELAELESWSAKELEDKLDERRRMAPARVYAVLEALREARRAWMASWPEAPQTRPEIVLCRLKRPELVAVPGGKP